MKKFFMIASGLIFFAGMTALSGCGTEQAEVKEEVKADTETQVSDKSQEKAESAGESDAVEESGETSEQESLMGNFVTKTLEGEEVTQEIFSEANLTMVNIWGTFCGPCIQEMPDLGELAEEYKDKMQLLGFISDVGDVNNPQAAEIIKLTNANYTHLLNSVELMQGYMGTVQLIPTTVFLDKDGKQVGETYTGAKSKEMWAEIIEEMLAKVEA